jgi:hypothetical protein
MNSTCSDGTLHIPSKQRVPNRPSAQGTTTSCWGRTAAEIEVCDDVCHWMHFGFEQIAARLRRWSSTSSANWSSAVCLSSSVAATGPPNQKVLAELHRTGPEGERMPRGVAVRPSVERSEPRVVRQQQCGEIAAHTPIARSGLRLVAAFVVHRRAAMSSRYASMQRRPTKRASAGPDWWRAPPAPRWPIQTSLPAVKTRSARWLTSSTVR